VGTDIVPGTYRTSGGLGGACYWARLRDSDTDRIVANDLKNGPMTVNIRASDYQFDTRGCQTWTKIT
jgi:hypothetical protein